MSNDPNLQVFILGQFAIAGADHAMKEIPAPKTRELLAYILLNRSIHSREKLAALFWPEHSTGQSRKLLSHVIWQLKSAVCELEMKKNSCIITDSSFLGVSPDVDLWLDAWQLEKVFEESQDVNGRDLAPEQFQALCTAAGLYKGELLPGCYSDWCIYERERLLRLYLLTLDKLLTYCEAQNLYEQGIKYGEAILRHDRAREKTHLQLMRMLHRAGHRTLAISQYRQCRQILADELGVEPSRSTKMLHQKICQDQPADSDMLEAQVPLHGRDIAASYKQIKETLTALQQHVDQLLQIMP